MAPQRGAGLTPEQINAFVEQQVVNGRILSLKHAMKLAALRSIGYAGQEGERTTAEQLIADAAKIEAYITKDLDGLKKKSGLVITNQMPPAAAGFKPGD